MIQISTNQGMSFPITLGTSEQSFWWNIHCLDRTYEVSPQIDSFITCILMITHWRDYYQYPRTIPTFQDICPTHGDQRQPSLIRIDSWSERALRHISGHWDNSWLKQGNSLAMGLHLVYRSMCYISSGLTPICSFFQFTLYKSKSSHVNSLAWLSCVYLSLCS